MRSSSLSRQTHHLVNGAIDLAITREDAEYARFQIKEGNDHIEVRETGQLVPRLGSVVLDGVQYEEYWHRKNGDYKCREGNWHVRGQKCECQPRVQARESWRCGRCEDGWTLREDPDPLYAGRRLASPCPDCNAAGAAELASFADHVRRQPYSAEAERQSRLRQAGLRYLSTAGSNPFVTHDATAVFQGPVSSGGAVDAKRRIAAALDPSGHRSWRLADWERLEARYPDPEAALSDREKVREMRLEGYGRLLERHQELTDGGMALEASAVEAEISIVERQLTEEAA